MEHWSLHIYPLYICQGIDQLSPTWQQVDYHNEQTMYVHLVLNITIHVHVYEYICMHHIHIETYTYVHTYMYTHTHIYIHTYIHIAIHTHAHTHTHACTHTHVCTHTHTHTHMHTCLNPSVKLLQRYLNEELTPSCRAPNLVRLPVLVKSVFNALVPAYWIDKLSALSAHTKQWNETNRLIMNTT